MTKPLDLPEIAITWASEHPSREVTLTQDPDYSNNLVLLVKAGPREVVRIISKVEREIKFEDPTISKFLDAVAQLSSANF